MESSPPAKYYTPSSSPNSFASLYLKAISPINIALVKYWGKLEPTKIIPMNSNISLTIDMAALRSMTTLKLVPMQGQSPAISLLLNGKESKVTSRIQNVVDRLQELARENREKLCLEFKQEGSSDILTVGSIDELLACDIVIDSNNNFNTAAGLASSSSGLSCLGVALATMYGLPREAVDFSEVARIGSGSAVRSIYGGLVKWEKGFSEAEKAEILAGNKEALDRVSKKAIAVPVQLASPEISSYWMDILSILICVVKPEPGQSTVKEIPSTEGMELSLKTSDLLKGRLSLGIPDQNIQRVIDAMNQKSFRDLARVIMQESN